MRSARSKAAIKRRVDYYIWHARSQPLLKLRKIIHGQFSSLGEVAIIGGLIRDLAQVGSAGFKSDVDLVINLNPASVDEFARSVKAVKNKFGGYRYSTPSWNIDFWSLETTWAGVQGHVNVKSMPDLLNCTFFTSDALLYIIEDKKLLTNENHLRDLFSGRLEINLLSNPSPHGNLLRAVRRTILRNMTVGPRLFSFVEGNLDRQAFGYIVENERRLYGSSIAAGYKDHLALREEFAIRRTRKPPSKQQLALPLLDDPVSLA